MKNINFTELFIMKNKSNKCDYCGEPLNTDEQNNVICSICRGRILGLNCISCGKVLSKVERTNPTNKEGSCKKCWKETTSGLCIVFTGKIADQFNRRCDRQDKQDRKALIKKYKISMEPVK
jgi:hypothetical protein